MRQFRICNALLAIGCLICLAVPAQNALGEQFAFLVGVREYAKTELSNLQFAEADIVELAATLRTSGYDRDNIVQMTKSEGTKEGRTRYLPLAANIREELRLLLAGLRAEDTLIVALAGHGVQFKGEKSAYFCPLDAKLGDRTTLISLEEIHKALELCPAQSKLLLVDACRNEPQTALSRSARGVELEAVGRPQAIKLPKSISALYSCSEGQQAFEDPELKHGVFFYYVLEALRGAGDLDGDRRITLDELKAYVKPLVTKRVRVELGQAQTPQSFDENAAIMVLANKILRIGIIGLDTSHVIAFTKALNAENPKPEFAGCRVVAAYPKGSPDIESSTSRVPGYTAEMQKLDVEIVDSIDVLLTKVDAVLLETNDGRPHREQVIPVLKAGKPVFIDKPLAGSLVDCVAIFELSKKYNAPFFTSSALRYGKNTQAVRGGAIGAVRSCETSSPASLEKTHPDLFWYGIHGVESLFTVMGPECVEVTRDTLDGKIRVSGRWSGERTGVFLEGKGYSGKAVGADGEQAVGSYDGYDPLLVEIVQFFRTKKPPVSEAETLAIYAFMEAADESKRQNGATVKLDAVLEKARKEAAESLRE